MCARQLRHIVLLSSSLLGVVPGLAADTPQEFRLATEGYRYAFPRDHGAHEEYRTEWWYYTGQVTAKNGRPFGYELTFFRRGMPREQTKTLPSQWAVTHLYLAHFAVSDLSKGRFHYAEKMSRAGLGKAGAARIISMSGSIGGAPNRRWPLPTRRSSMQRTATWPSSLPSRRKNRSSCMAPTGSATKVRHRTSLPLLFLHQTGHNRHAHDRKRIVRRDRHELDGP